MSKFVKAEVQKSSDGYHVETVKVADDRKAAPGRLDLQIAAAAGGAASGSGLWAQLEAAKQADAAAAYDKKASMLQPETSLDEEDAAFMNEVQSNADAKRKLARRQAQQDEVAFLSKLAAKSALEEPGATPQAPAPPTAQGGTKRPRSEAAQPTEDEDIIDASALRFETDVDASSAKRRRATQGTLPSAAALLRVKTAPPPATHSPDTPQAPAPAVGLVAYDSSSDEDST